MHVEQIELDDIRTDGGTQMRVVVDDATCREYRDLWADGVKFPPLDVFYDGEDYWLADGFHRYYGAAEAQLQSVLCNIHEGTNRDAILFAVSANATNGLRRTNKDKRHAALALLNDDEWKSWSDRQIADKAGVTHPFVAKLRAGLETVTTTTRRAPSGGSMDINKRRYIGAQVIARSLCRLIPTPDEEVALLLDKLCRLFNVKDESLAA